jgi:hypothetical protein
MVKFVSSLNDIGKKQASVTTIDDSMEYFSSPAIVITKYVAVEIRS